MNNVTGAATVVPAKPTTPSLGANIKEVVNKAVIGIGNVVNKAAVAVKSGALFVAGTGYQIVDSTLFNVASNSAKLAGKDINKVNSLPFQIGRQTGNNTVLALSVLGIAGGTGTAAAGAVITSGVALCVATLAGGGTMLVPCTVTGISGGALTAIGAGTAAASGILFSNASKNQDGINKAVQDAKGGKSTQGGGGGTQLPKQVEALKSPKSVIDAERNALLKRTTDPEARNIINEVFRKESEFLGGTAGILKIEKQYGIKLSPNGHAGKAQDSINRINNLLAKPGATFDKSTISVLNEIKSGLTQAIK